MNTFLRVTICSVSGCIGRIEEKFTVERWLGLHVNTDSICIFVRPHALVAAIYELKNKVCHYWPIVTQFRDRHIQVKNNEIVDSGSLKGDRVRYIQVTAICRST